jgi:hypothetical protein
VVGRKKRRKMGGKDFGESKSDRIATNVWASDDMQPKVSIIHKEGKEEES